MPNIKSSKKSMRKDEARRLANRSRISAVKTSRKSFEKALLHYAKDKTTEALNALEQSFQKAQSLFARAGRKNLMHRNKASRNIARMMRTKASALASAAA